MKTTGIHILAVTAALSLTTNAFAEEPEKDIVETAVAAGSFQTLAAALTAADLVGALQGEGPFTVFAPTDEAFAKLPEGTVETLLKPENVDQLRDILTYHVVAGAVPFAAAAGLESASALNEKSLDLSVTGGRLMVNNATVIENDIATSNGTIHVIDTVLLPPATEDEKEAAAAAASSANEVATHAIHRGVMLFNAGDHAACVEVYTNAAQMILQMPEGAVNCATRTAVQHALAKAEHRACATTNAWSLRHALGHAVVAAR